MLDPSIVAAKAKLTDAQIAYQSYMAGPEGEAIRSYKSGYERIWNQVYDRTADPSSRVFDDDVRDGYDWLLKVQMQTAPYRVKARKLADERKQAEAELKAVERRVKNAYTAASEW